MAKPNAVFIKLLSVLVFFCYTNSYIQCEAKINGGLDNIPNAQNGKNIDLVSRKKTSPLSGRHNYREAESIIEEVNAKQLERILNEKDFVAVYWCESKLFSSLYKLKTSRLDFNIRPSVYK